MDKISEIFKDPVPSCSEVIVPLNENNYIEILENTSQAVLNKVVDMWEELESEGQKTKGKQGEAEDKKNITGSNDSMTGGSNKCNEVSKNPTNGWKEFKPELANCDYVNNTKLEVGDFGGNGDCQFLSIAAGLNIGKFQKNDNYTCQMLRNEVSKYVNKLNITKENDVKELLDLWIAIAGAGNDRPQNFQKSKYKLIEDIAEQQYNGSVELPDLKFNDQKDKDKDKINAFEEFKSYIAKKIKQSGDTYWGDNITLSILTKIYKNLGFIIFSSDYKSITMIGEYFDNQNKEYLMLYYVNRNHYQLIKQKNDTILLNKDIAEKIKDECVETEKSINRPNSAISTKHISSEVGKTTTRTEENIHMDITLIPEARLGVTEGTPGETEKRFETIKDEQTKVRYTEILTHFKTIPEEISEIEKELTKLSNSDEITLHFKDREGNKLETIGDSRNDIKIGVLQILVNKYVKLLDSFIKKVGNENYSNMINEEECSINDGGDKKYSNIIKIRNCFCELLKNYMGFGKKGEIEQFKKENENCYNKNYKPNLRFTNGVITYLDRMNEVFTKNVDLTDDDKKFLFDISRNINMIIAVMYYIVEQIYSFDVKKKNKNEQSKSEEELFTHILIRVLTDDDIKNIKEAANAKAKEAANANAKAKAKAAKAKANAKANAKAKAVANKANAKAKEEANAKAKAEANAKAKEKIKNIKEKIHKLLQNLKNLNKEETNITNITDINDKIFKNGTPPDDALQDLPDFKTSCKNYFKKFFGDIFCEDIQCMIDSYNTVNTIDKKNDISNGDIITSKNEYEKAKICYDKIINKLKTWNNKMFETFGHNINIYYYHKNDEIDNLTIKTEELKSYLNTNHIIETHEKLNTDKNKDWFICYNSINYWLGGSIKKNCKEFVKYTPENYSKIIKNVKNDIIIAPKEYFQKEKSNGKFLNEPSYFQEGGILENLFNQNQDKYFLIKDEESINPKVLAYIVRDNIPHTRVFCDGKQYDRYQLDPPEPLNDIKEFGAKTDMTCDDKVYTNVYVRKIINYIAIASTPKYIAIASTPKHIAIASTPKYIAIAAPSESPYGIMPNVSK